MKKPFKELKVLFRALRPTSAAPLTAPTRASVKLRLTLFVWVAASNARRSAAAASVGPRNVLGRNAPEMVISMFAAPSKRDDGEGKPAGKPGRRKMAGRGGMAGKDGRPGRDGRSGRDNRAAACTVTLARPSVGAIEP